MAKKNNKKKGNQKWGVMTWKELKRYAEDHGWYHDRTRGDDFIMKHPELPGIITVTYGKTYVRALLLDNIKAVHNGGRTGRRTH